MGEWGRQEEGNVKRERGLVQQNIQPLKSNLTHLPLIITLLSKYLIKENTATLPAQAINIT